MKQTIFSTCPGPPFLPTIFSPSASLMKQTIFSTCSGPPFLPTLNLLPLLFLFFFLLHPIPSSCIDPYYYNCTNPEARTCGDGQLISFPFFIQGKQDSFCGFPGFNLTCDINGQPILKLQDTNFVIKDINYTSQSIRVSNTVVSNTDSSSSSCLPLISNVSFPEDKFRFPVYDPPDDLFLLYNCNYSGTDKLNKYKLNCSSLSDATLAVFGGDSLLGYASSKCQNAVEVPVDRGGSGDDDQGEVVELVRRGFVLNWVGSNCSECEESGGRCGFDGTSYFVKCFCPDRPHSRRCKGRNNLGLPLGLGIGIGVLLMIIVTYVFWRYRKRKRTSSKLRSGNSSSDASLEDDLERGSLYFGVPVFSYRELEVATSNFSSENEIGDGGFGTVYYGKLGDGREVAVKRMYEHNYRRVEQFMNEIKILTRMRHKNLVSLYGCTSHRSKELLLVYEYIPNGTVADHLHGDRAKDRPLTWPIRMSIAIETASALAYLHASGIIHRDVKTNNILLDENCSVKVADFGLSRLFPSGRTHVSTAPQGTPGYVDPEYHQCYQLTDKSDVYSFGVVLIELISSMPAVDISRDRSDINLANLAVRKITECAVVELIDPWLDHKKNTEIKCLATSVAELAFRCLQLEKDMRPTMVEVVEELIQIQSCEEGHDDKNEDEKKIPRPPSSDQEHDEDSLLRHLPSPISVTDKWVSTSSTATTSDTNG